jgi:hypothetical protein
MTEKSEEEIRAEHDAIAADPRVPADVTALQDQPAPPAETEAKPQDTAGGDHAAEESQHSRSRAGSGGGHQSGTRKAAEPGGG